MLSAKFTRYWELVHASPHARELMASQGEIGAELIQRFDPRGQSVATVSRDGTASPTSIGILHYRADGSVHIIPGRPQ